jgi:tRNA G10  N-methylase Trm11
MKKYLYVYNYYPQFEESMALMEFRNIFHADYEKYHFTDIDFDIKRSVFIKARLTIFHEATTIPELIALLEKDDLYYEDFKVEYYKNDITHYDYQRSLKEASMLSEPIPGTTDLEHPKVELAFTYIKGTYYFGLLERNKDWHKYEVKPYSYSHSLPIKCACVALNLGLKDMNDTIIDPCCGVGTVVLEGLGLHLNIVGSDINRYVSYKARLNLKYFGFDPLLITKRDIHDIKEHYNLCIMDVPYGVVVPFSIEEQLDLIKASYPICDRLVVITHVNLNAQIEDLGYIIKDHCVYKRGNFERFITLCVKES